MKKTQQVLLSVMGWTHDDDEPSDSVDLTPRDTHVRIDLGVGTHSATILTNDLTHDYVHENSAYAS